MNNVLITAFDALTSQSAHYVYLDISETIVSIAVQQVAKISSVQRNRGFAPTAVVMVTSQKKIVAYPAQVVAPAALTKTLASNVELDSGDNTVNMTAPRHAINAQRRENAYMVMYTVSSLQKYTLHQKKRENLLSLY